ncbi:MAG TPA: DUF4845 domain-containing protein [Steroidobacteraceae bacterium]|nr:DUF4845 domain-containing protein [Steroidobacteraceae bacterium]
MKSRQRGVTMIGWICLLVPVAIVVYAAIRVTPKYMSYYKLVQAMKETATQLKSDETLTATSVRNALGKRFDTGYVEVDPKEIEVTKGETGWVMHAEYEETAPLFGNLSLLLTFNETVPIN